MIPSYHPCVVRSFESLKLQGEEGTSSSSNIHTPCLALTPGRPTKRKPSVRQTPRCNLTTDPLPHPHIRPTNPICIPSPTHHSFIFLSFLEITIESLLRPSHCEKMATTTGAGVLVDGVSFPPSSRAPGSPNTFFLAGAGARGLEIEGKLINFTAIGVYLEEATSLSALAPKWKGKTADDLSGSVEFFRDVVAGPFEKFFRVTMIKPLTGAQYSEKVTENCVNIWKSVGIYTESEGQAAHKFREIFKDQVFPPGSSILFTQSPAGKVTIAFSKDDSVPEVGNGVIENKPMSEAVLTSIIGANGVSPATKRSLAEHVAAMLDCPGDDGRGKAEEAAKLDGSGVGGKSEKAADGTPE